MNQNEEKFDEDVVAFAEKQEAGDTGLVDFAEDNNRIDPSQEARTEKQEKTVLVTFDENQETIIGKEDTINENDETTEEVKPFYRSWLMYFLLLAFGLFIGTNLYFKSQIKINAPEVDLGEKVVIILQNGQEMKTYENLLVEKEKKIYYKGEFNTIDVTEGIIVYKDWE